MSLEQALEKNTAALVALTAALSASNAAAPKAPAANPPKTAATPPTPTPPAGTTKQQPTYDAVAKVVSDFVKANGRAPAVLLLAPFNVQTLVPLRDKPVELAAAYDAFTDPVKTAAAIAAAAPKA